MRNYLRVNLCSICCALTLLFSLSLPFGLEAKHIIGGEMTYRFVEQLPNGQNRYEFTLIVYRDCDSGGGPLDNPGRIAIYRGDANNANLVTSFNASLQPIEAVSPVIPPCADASAVSNACVQRGVYIFTRDLDVLANESYFVVYQRCCRTEQIVNIVNPGSIGATYMVEISPLAQALQNSSPTFNNYPPTFICSNFPLNFDHSATDNDGDSLVYSFCRPFAGGGQGGNGCNSPTPNPPCGPPFPLVNYTAGYSSANPMGGMPTITVDASTGQLSGTPILLGQFVVGICVQEYRNGQLIGQILRDFQFNVVDCTPTVIANINAEEVVGPKAFLVKRCGQKTITILNTSPLTPDLNSWEWEFDLGNGNVYSSSAWNATFLIPDYGEYQGHMYLNRYLNCPDSAIITLKAFPGVDAAFDYNWDICAETPLFLSDSSVSGSIGGITNRLWTLGSPADTLYGTEPAVSLTTHGTYAVSLFVKDSDGCTDQLTKNITWDPQLPPIIPQAVPASICLPTSLAFTTLDSLNLTGSKITWDFGDGQTSAQKSPVHDYQSAGAYTVSIHIQTAFDCISTDTFVDLVHAYDPPMAGFDWSPKTLSNLDNRVFFESQSSTDVVQWDWHFGDEGRSSHPTPSWAFQDTGLTQISLRVFNYEGCTDSITQVLDIVPQLRLYIPNVFSPDLLNGNGNDRFSALGIIPGYQSYQMSIYSRWGELVFEGNSPDEYWDGRKANSGKYVEKGVYVYLLKIIGPRGELYQYEGTVTVI